MRTDPGRRREEGRRILRPIALQGAGLHRDQRGRAFARPSAHQGAGQLALTSGEGPVVSRLCMWCQSSPGVSRRPAIARETRDPQSVPKSEEAFKPPQVARQDPVRIRTSPGLTPIRRLSLLEYKASDRAVHS
jgi:hypothetical protein